jgi:hypothetical protein
MNQPITQGEKTMSTSTSTQTSTAPTTYDTWPAGNGTKVLSSEKSDDGNCLEPSGLTIYTDSNNVKWLYLASDNGRIARMKVSQPNKWAVQSFFDSDDKQGDFESICVAKGKLMVGVEGGDKDGDPTYAHIERFTPDTSDDSLGSFTGSKWKISDIKPDDKSGMEGMTFVPDGSYPASWLPSKQNGKSLCYGGVFLVSFQSAKDKSNNNESTAGYIFVYDLPEGNKDSHDVSYVHKFSDDLLSTRKISDLDYDASSQLLYVLYDDDGNTTDVLQALTLNSSGIAFNYQTIPPYYGCEGVTVDGTTLYLALDQNSDQWKNNGHSGSTITNYVYEFDGYTTNWS